MSVPRSNPSRSEAEQIEHLTRQLQMAELKIRLLEEKLRLQRIKKYGPKSETLSDAQLELLDLEPGVSTAEIEAESRREPLPATSEAVSSPIPRQPRKHPGRQSLPGHLPRIEQVLACSPEQCVCGVCGQATVVIGFEESEQLEVEPARYFALRIKREKRACPACPEAGVKAATAPERIIEKGLVSNQIVIGTIVSKYQDHLPLYRQSAMLERDAGVPVSRATMDGWVMRTGELLIPVAQAMRRELLLSRYLQTDETPVPVQMQEGRGKNHQAYLWQYGQPGGAVVFDFQLGRGREGPRNFLNGFEGILQTDGYSAYESAAGGRLVHAACWAHARRKVIDALKLNPEDSLARRLLAQMNELFAIDAEARAAGLNEAARHRLREQRARPLAAAIRQELESARRAVLPASAVGKAIHYSLSLWPKLTCFLDHPIVELSNNLAENSMRPVVLGRKNWIHVGSQQAGPRVAAILSVVESCRRLSLPLRDYLNATLPGLANRSIQTLKDCTPVAWATARTR